MTTAQLIVLQFKARALDSKSLAALRELVPTLWGERWDPLEDPLKPKLVRADPVSDKAAAAQLSRLVQAYAAGPGEISGGLEEGRVAPTKDDPVFEGVAWERVKRAAGAIVYVQPGVADAVDLPALNDQWQKTEGLPTMQITTDAEEAAQWAARDHLPVLSIVREPAEALNPWAAILEGLSAQDTLSPSTLVPLILRALSQPGRASIVTDVGLLLRLRSVTLRDLLDQAAQFV